MSDAHSIMWHAERAAVEYIREHAPEWLPPLQIYRGRENREDQAHEGQESSLKIRPCVVCKAETARAIRENWSGRWTVPMSIDVEANRSNTDGDTADAQAIEILNLFLAVEIIPNINGATEHFNVRDVLPEEITLHAEGRAWITTLTLSLEQAGIV